MRGGGGAALSHTSVRSSGTRKTGPRRRAARARSASPSFSPSKIALPASLTYLPAAHLPILSTFIVLPSSLSGLGYLLEHMLPLATLSFPHSDAGGVEFINRRRSIV